MGLEKTGTRTPCWRTGVKCQWLPLCKLEIFGAIFICPTNTIWADSEGPRGASSTQLQNYSLKIRSEAYGEPHPCHLCSSCAQGTRDFSCWEDARGSVCSAQRTFAKQGGLCASGWAQSSTVLHLYICQQRCHEGFSTQQAKNKSGVTPAAPCKQQERRFPMGRSRLELILSSLQVTHFSDTEAELFRDLAVTLVVALVCFGAVATQQAGQGGQFPSWSTADRGGQGRPSQRWCRVMEFAFGNLLF